MPRYSNTITDQYGEPLVGIQITVLDSDGNAAALTDDAGGALSNPVASDSDGVFYFNVALGQYTLELRQSSSSYVFATEAISLDSLNYGDVSGASLIGFIQSGTGATARTAQDKLRERVTPEDFSGATPQAKIVAAATAFGLVDLAKASTYTLTAAMAISANKSIEGNRATINGTTADQMLTAGGAINLSSLVLDGTSMPVPTADWGTGIAKGSFSWIAGAGSGSRLGPMRWDNIYAKNFPNGVANFKYVQDMTIGDFVGDSNQTSTAFVRSHVLGIHTGQRMTLGDLRFNGFTLKALDLSYAQSATVGSVNSVGGGSANADLHIEGGQLIAVGSTIHDGSTNNGYGTKVWNVRLLNIACKLGLAEKEVVQVYGSHGHWNYIEGKDTVSNVVNVDSRDARIGETTAEVETRIDRIVDHRTNIGAADTARSTLAIRDDDNATPCSINLIDAGSIYSRGASFGVRSTAIGGLVDWVVINELNVADLDPNGYPAYLMAKNTMIKRLIIPKTLESGCRFFTNSANRGGHIVIENGLFENGVTSTEPMLALGAAGAFSFSEGGWKAITIGNIEADGGGQANAKLLEIDLHSVDQCVSINLHDIVGRNFVAAQQIGLTLFSGTAKAPVINLSNSSVTNAAGAQLGMTITNGSGIVGGQISDNWRLPITGRPAKAAPYYVRDTYDPGSIAGGATDAERTVTITGARAGDRVFGQVNINGWSVVDAYVSANDTVKYKLKNMTAGAIDPPSSNVDMFVMPRTVV